MLNDVLELPAKDLIPKRLLNVITSYVAFLTIFMKKHTFSMCAKLSGLDESRFCALMNEPQTKPLSESILNRAFRRRLHHLKRTQGKLIFIIDATIHKRSSKGIENVGCYHNGKHHVWGQKFINFVVLDGTEVVPIESKLIYTKSYCESLALEHKTEPQIVAEWIRALRGKKLFTDEDLREAIFLLDSGYDAKVIQHAIFDIEAHFVMALRPTRIINKQQARKLFRKKDLFKTQTIRLCAGSGGKGSRRTFSVQTAPEALMKGFGKVTVICSKSLDKKARPNRFIATSVLYMTPQEIAKWYQLRWKIEVWHREMKQNFGFIDCKCKRAIAIESHINFSLSAYLLQRATGKTQTRIEDYVFKKELQFIKVELTKFGAIPRLRTHIYEALGRFAA